MHRRGWMGILALVVVLMAPGMSAPPPQDDAPTEGEQPVPEVEKPLVIPEVDKNRKNPFHGDPRSADNGKSLFNTQCTMCHGTSGDGKGDLVKRLGMKVPDFTDPAVQQSRTDGELHYILTRGCKDMPGDGERMPDEWKWDLINYIRTLEKG